MKVMEMMEMELMEIEKMIEIEKTDTTPSALMTELKKIYDDLPIRARVFCDTLATNEAKAAYLVTEATSLKTEATSTGTDATPSALMTELKKDSQERVCFVILLPPNEAKAAYLVSSIKDDRKNIPQKRTILIIVINSLTSDSNNKNNEMTSYLLSVFIEQVIAKIMD
ncbi:hypothetical protein GLOIN_2v1771629 [Rhizophagus irregularis DAOM 181602=DAOM 197198]|uniref:Uncharacterized protein n=1 Tax=Rhizophagus irregularis (strain DAOM 181602 / DAOM 197198 / MUCL 43194) TaxID=747089 RepID=A0A2P4Q984_RHIID|nr:hypothetical protein GLOIN_2v1771629 [Rhizophagus irregularis DAOM 181602=DAOM 197198]POG74205.1 hypothetical protein GLOIN_2v1771629 [Rhizophagus irregularis DAOM 181602=DAOM 197198]|eukprot:XP_025181071.1 hypothetical protein GLOIN_2v1771629 [Rhizophagus irregularis DAOM 181602=DAOM 197198]